MRNREKQRDEEAVLIQKAEEKERKRVAKANKHQGIEQHKVEREAKAEARRVEAAKKQAKRERKNKSATTRKLYKLPNQASAKPHEHQLQRPSARSLLVVVQQLLKFNLLLHSRLQAVATLSSYQRDTHKVISTSFLQCFVYYFTQQSCNNSYCCCLYSLML
jgi:hypothetical protein